MNPELDWPRNNKQQQTVCGLTASAWKDATISAGIGRQSRPEQVTRFSENKKRPKNSLRSGGKATKSDEAPEK